MSEAPSLRSNLPVPYHQPEQGMLVPTQQPDEVELTKLIGYYTAAEEASQLARQNSERDRDYVDNKQLTEDEVRALKKRGQPPIVLNVVRSRASFLAGMEKKQRRDPKAYPRNNPEDAAAAEAFTEGLRYVVQTADYPSKRSQAWKNITVEGFGGVELAAVKKGDDTEFTISRIPWDRLFFDPHSAEPDFSDARYIGQVMWMDYDEALARAAAAGYVDEAEATDILETTMGAQGGLGRTYDDKPQWTVWADGKRKRVRIVMMWHKEPTGWEYCEFTKGGKLAYSVGAYVDQDGETYCPWIIESANVDRDNNRYGELRNLIDPQDEINKRRSKALHQLNTRGVITEAGAVADVNATRRELVKPDYWIEINPGVQRFEIKDGAELAAGQAQMGAEAMAYIREAGPNQALLGKGTQDQSGKAIEAQQAGGLVEQSDLMDVLRRLDLRVFTVAASMMKQFWTAQKWIRVTDSDDVTRWIGLNEPMWADPGTGKVAPESQWKDHFDQGGDPQDPDQAHRLMPATDPETGEPALANHVARLNMDIIVSDAPDTITMAGDDWQAMTQLLGLNLPPDRLKLAIEMHPALPAKRKKEFIDMIDQEAQKGPPPGQQEAQQLAIEKLKAEIAEIRASAFESLAAGDADLAKSHLPPDPPPPMPGDPGAPMGLPPAPDAPPAPMPPSGGPMQPPHPQAGPPGPPLALPSPAAGMMSGHPQAPAMVA